MKEQNIIGMQRRKTMNIGATQAQYMFLQPIIMILNQTLFIIRLVQIFMSNLNTQSQNQTLYITLLVLK